MTTQEGKLYLGGELFNVTGNNIIADADYIVDRTINKTQGEINQTLNLEIDRASYEINAHLFPGITESVNNGVSIPVDKVTARVNHSGNFISDLGSKLLEYSFDNNPTWKNNISYNSWKEGVTVDTLNSESTVERPSVLNLRLIDVSNNIYANATVVLKVSTTVYTKSEVDSAIITAISASGSGTTTNLQEANLQDIQAVFNMQYQQASPEVIDPHDNP